MGERAPPVVKPTHKRAWIAALLWLATLMLTAPALVRVWPIGELRVDASMLDLAFGADDSLAGVRPVAYAAALYLMLCGGAWIWFILRCRIKRFLLLALAVLLTGLELSLGLFGFDRVLIAMAGISVAGVAVEVIRQNKDLFVSLKNSDIRFATLLWRALLLWSPSLVLIALGLLFSALLNRWSMQAIYGSGTVEEHCEIRGRSEPTKEPCAYLGRRGERPVVEELSLRRAVEENVGDAVWVAHRQLLEATADQAQWASPGLSTAALDSYLEIVGLTLEPVVMSAGDSAENVLDSDSELARLRKQRQVLESQARAPPPIVLVGLANAALLIKWSVEQKARVVSIRTLDSQIANRGRKLRTDFDTGNPSAAMKRTLHQQLSSRLNLRAEFGAARKRLDDAWARRPAKASNAVRATVRAELLRILAAKQGALVDVASAVYATNVDVAINAGLHTRRCLFSFADDEEGDDRIRACPSDRVAEQPLAVSPLPFLESVKLSLDGWAARSERQIEAGLQEASAATFKAGDEAQRIAAALYDTTPRSLGLRTKSNCGINPFCYASNYAKRQAESTYKNARADFQNKFKRAVHRNATLGVLSANEQIDAAREEMQRDLERSHAAALQAVEGAHSTFEVVSTVLTVFLVFAAIKSFLYVLALEIFHESGAADVGFDVPAAPEGTYVQEPSLSVPREFSKSIWSFALGLNQTKRLVIWKPWVAFLGRLFRLRFMMNHGTHATDGAIKFPLGPGLTGVRWSMREGEQVVFKFRELLGFSDNVRIRTEVSLRLSTLLLGTYFFTVAECADGDGLLLLSIRGTSGAEGDKVEMVSVGTLKAWNLHTKFRVFGDQTASAVFKDGFMLSRRDAGKEGRGKILAGASHGGELSVEGLVWYAKTFLMPF